MILVCYPRIITIINEKLLFCNPDKSIVTNGKTLFHQQIIKAWQETNNTNPKDNKEILSQRLLMNQHIKISGEMIDFNFFGNMESMETTIRDIMTVNGKFKTRENVNRLLNVNIDDMKYNSIKTAIPTEWKKIISKCAPICNNIDGPPQNLPSIIINGKYKIWSKITSKDIYRQITKEKKVEPTSTETWEKRFLFTPNWKAIYNLPYKITSEPYLQSFQYKILNRILNCNDKLHTWGIKKTMVNVHTLSFAKK